MLMFLSVYHYMQSKLSLIRNQCKLYKRVQWDCIWLKSAKLGFKRFCCGDVLPSLRQHVRLKMIGVHHDWTCGLKPVKRLSGTCHAKGLGLNRLPRAFCVIRVSGMDGLEGHIAISLNKAHDEMTLHSSITEGDSSHCTSLCFAALSVNWFSSRGKSRIIFAISDF